MKKTFYANVYKNDHDKNYSYPLYVGNAYENLEKCELCKLNGFNDFTFLKTISFEVEHENL